MRAGRRNTRLPAIPLAVALGLLVALPVGAASPIPSGAAGPVDGAAVLDRALAALGELTSYRVDNRSVSTLTGDAQMVTTVVDINAPVPAMRYQVAVDGEVGIDLIVTGDEGWMSTYGGPFRPDEETGWSATGMDADLGLDTLRKLVSEGLVTELVGRETIDGRDTLHYTARTIDPLISPPPDAYYRRTMTGTLDLWVDATQGFLVHSELDMVRHDDLSESFGIDALRMHEVATVTAIDDPANLVEPPDLALATRPPGQVGDPALAPVVRGALDALAAHASFGISSVGSTLGSETRRETTVVNGPVPAIEDTLSAYGREWVSLIQVGEQEWSRAGGDGPWYPSSPEATRCGDVPCTADDFLRADLVRQNAETFTLVNDGELLEGVPTLHLRSSAGAASEDTGWIPGTLDLWIAKDGGHLLRLAGDGQAVEWTLRIVRIDDPANVVEAPTDVVPTDAPG